MKNQFFWQRLFQSFKKNRQQVKFGSYAAELSFYVLWALVPILLALANVISILPINQNNVINMMAQGLPVEVRSILLPLLKDYLQHASTSIFSLGLIISLWPASNVFNTIQRVFNTIYQAEPRKNALVSRLFAYIFTILMVVGAFILTSIIMFSEQILRFVQDVIPHQFDVVSVILSQSWVLGIILLFLILVIMYHFIPNVNWPIKYAFPGTVFAFLGFNAISQLFTIYLNFAKNSISNQTIGIFIILMIWLYFVAMVLCLGAYINVLYHDYKEPGSHIAHLHRDGQIFEHHSPNFLGEANVLTGKISKATYHPDK